MKCDSASRARLTLSPLIEPETSNSTPTETGESSSLKLVISCCFLSSTSAPGFCCCVSRSEEFFGDFESGVDDFVGGGCTMSRSLFCTGCGDGSSRGLVCAAALKAPKIVTAKTMKETNAGDVDWRREFI